MKDSMMMKLSVQKDMDMMYRLLNKAKKISIVDECLYNYLDVNDNRLTKKYNKESLDDFRTVILKFHDFIKKEFLLKEQLSFNIVTTYLVLFDMYCKSSNKINKKNCTNDLKEFRKNYSMIKNNGLKKYLTKKQLIKANILNLNFIIYKLFINIYAFLRF